MGRRRLNSTPHSRLKKSRHSPMSGNVLAHIGTLEMHQRGYVVVKLMKCGIKTATLVRLLCVWVAPAC